MVVPSELISSEIKDKSYFPPIKLSQISSQSLRELSHVRLEACSSINCTSSSQAGSRCTSAKTKSHSIYPVSPVKSRALNPLRNFFFFGDIYGSVTRYGSQAGHVQFHLQSTPLVPVLWPRLLFPELRGARQPSTVADQHNVFRAADVTSFYKQQYEQMVFREFSLPPLKHLRWVTNGSFVSSKAA